MNAAAAEMRRAIDNDLLDALVGPYLHRIEQIQWHTQIRDDYEKSRRKRD